MIKYEQTFHKMLPCGFDGVFDWDFLKGAFGPKIMPMDLDGIVESNGRFLVFETKSDESVPIPLGQKVALEMLVKTEFFTVIIVYGKTKETITSLELWVKGPEKRICDPANHETVYKICSKWYKAANRQPPPIYPSQYEGMITDLKNRNSDLFQNLRSANYRISELEKFKLEASVPTRNRKNQVRSFDLFSARRDLITVGIKAP